MQVVNEALLRSSNGQQPYLLGTDFSLGDASLQPLLYIAWTVLRHAADPLDILSMDDPKLARYVDDERSGAVLALKEGCVLESKTQHLQAEGMGTCCFRAAKLSQGASSGCGHSCDLFSVWGEPTPPLEARVGSDMGFVVLMRCTCICM